MEPARVIELRRVETLADAAAFLQVRNGEPEMYPVPKSPEVLLHAAPVEIRWLAFSGTEVLVGTASLRSEKPAASIGICVDSEHRGAGWGAKILEAVEVEAKDLGFTVIRADIFKGNSAALHLFSGAGYREFVNLEKHL